MSQRIDKARKKAFRKEYHDVASAFAEKNEQILKPCPRWIPVSVYMWMLSFFIIIKKRK